MGKLDGMALLSAKRLDVFGITSTIVEAIPTFAESCQTSVRIGVRSDLSKKEWILSKINHRFGIMTKEDCFPYCSEVNIIKNNKSTIIHRKHIQSKPSAIRTCCPSCHRHSTDRAVRFGRSGFTKPISSTPRGCSNSSRYYEAGKITIKIQTDLLVGLAFCFLLNNCTGTKLTAPDITNYAV